MSADFDAQRWRAARLRGGGMHAAAQDGGQGEKQAANACHRSAQNILPRLLDSDYDALFSAY
ncbi:MAG: hypothetical protein VW835_01240 [Rickettsiales bacterium]